MQLVKKFPAFHVTRRFITALTSVRHLSLSRANPIQSIYPHPTSWRFILILSTHLRLGLRSGLFPSGFLTKALYTPSPRPYAPHVQPISLFSILSPAQYWVRSSNHSVPRYAITSIPLFPRPSSVQIFSSTPYSQTPSASFPPSMSATKFHTHTHTNTRLNYSILLALKLTVTHLSTLLAFHKLRSHDQKKVFRIHLYVSNVWLQYR